MGLGAEFWEQVYLRYRGQDVRLPVRETRQSIRAVLDAVDCRSAGCTLCCRKYRRLQVSHVDIERIRESCGEDIEPAVSIHDGVMHFDISGGCRFVYDQGCRIYRYRPDGCYFIPLQFGHQYDAEGNQRDENLYIRIDCKPAVAAVRRVMELLMREQPALTLTPDLRLIET